MNEGKCVKCRAIWHRNGSMEHAARTGHYPDGSPLVMEADNALEKNAYETFTAADGEISIRKHRCIPDQTADLLAELAALNIYSRFDLAVYLKPSVIGYNLSDLLADELEVGKSYEVEMENGSTAILKYDGYLTGCGEKTCIHHKKKSLRWTTQDNYTPAGHMCISKVIRKVK